MPFSHRVGRERSSTILFITLGVALGALLATVGSPVGAVRSTPPTASMVVTPTTSLASHPHLPAFPPVHVHPIGVPAPDAVNPTAYYSSEPAPMGIGDFGIGAGGNPYTYSTSEFLGNFSWQTLNLQESGNTQFTDQLNVVLQFVQNGITYAYWIQDVAFMDSSTNELTFENNIWNFTSNCMDNTAVQGNGTVNVYSGCQGYYAVGASSQPGADEFMPNPGDFGLLVRAYQTVGGLPEVAFEYWDGVTSYYVTYDNVVFPWASGLSSDNNFVVDGYEYNPLGLYYDAELTIGGPGGGAATQAQPTTHAASRLLYWNGHNFEAPPSVWNFGSNTAEAVSNIQSVFSNDRAGLPLTVQLNGTTRNATPAKAYDQNRVGELAITATGLSSGTVAIPGDVWDFVGASAALTLTPGTYRVWVNSTSQNYDLGLCAIAAGVTTSASITSGCGPLVSTPTPSVSSVDLGQSVTFQSTLLSAGSGGDSYTWTTSPSGLGCTPSTTLTLSCTPTVAGVYKINVTATDSDGHSGTSGTLQFTVSTDPSVGAPVPSKTEVETGASVSFTVSPSGGARPYSYQWHDLPTPCTGTTTASPTCTPSTSGTHSIYATVTDANGYLVTSPTLPFTVLTGPAITAPTSSPVGSVDLGQRVTFSTSVTGGSGSYSYTWSGLPTGCPATSARLIACTPTGTGVFTISVVVVDSLGGSASSATLIFTVHSDPTIGTLTDSPQTIDLGQTIRFALSGPSTGGAGSYRYLWTGLPAGCASNDSLTLTCTPIESGFGETMVTVYDADNGTNATTVLFVVFIDPDLSVVSASPDSIDLGQNVTFSAIAVGGSGGLTYDWSGLPTGCVGWNSSSIQCSPTSVSTSRINLTITDTKGLSSNRSFTFVVDPDPTVSTPTASPGSGTAGQTVTFSASASGGSGGFSYSWTGLPPGCQSVNASSITCQPSSAGTYEVSVSVNDSNGYHVQSGDLRFSVAAASTFLGLSWFEGYALIVEVAVIVAIVLAVILVRRSRQRRKQPPS